MTAAAQHLRHAKGLDPMITASKSGLPIDITKVRNLLCRPNNTIHMRGETADARVLNMLSSLVIARGDNVRPKWKMKRRKGGGNNNTFERNDISPFLRFVPHLWGVWLHVYISFCHHLFRIPSFFLPLPLSYLPSISVWLIPYFN